MIKNPFNFLVIVASLGYFVDIYDLILFNVIKKESLEMLGLGGVNYESSEIFLFNCQMIGMLFGGILWGVLGDKIGRLKVLFGSILLYSAANIANAFTTELYSYASVRFLAGLGLAGELGAGITLVVETMHKKFRGYGTMIIVTFGVLGAVFAGMVGKEGAFLTGWINKLFGESLAGWQIAYIVGGLMGLVLLFLRIGTIESGMFKDIVKEKNVTRGNFRILFKPGNLLKYLKCISIGVPIWYVVGLLVALSVAISKDTGVKGIDTGTAIMYAYIGLSVGDLISGLLSQYFRSRKKVVVGYLIFLSVLMLLYSFPVSSSLTWFYILCFLMGCGTGYWVLFVTIASEQFGTNIRSTVTNTVPNFARGSVVPITLLYKSLKPLLDSYIYSALIVGIICLAIAFYSILTIEETFGKELNYVEK